MSINIPNNDQVQFKLHQFADIEGSVVHMLAVKMYANVAEFTQEMILDAPHEYPNKDAIEGQYADMTQVALDFAHDFIEDLKYALTQQIQQTRVVGRVRSIEYDRAGMIDNFSVDIDVN